LLYIFRLCLFI